MNPTIARFRSFNRFYTRLLGLLNRHLLDSPLTLAQARVLFETVQAPGSSASVLAEKVDMDPGQLSRILARLAKMGLILRQSGSSGRKSGRKAVPLHPAPAGLELLRRIEDTANHQASGLMETLDTGRQSRLVQAMAEIESLLAGKEMRDSTVEVRGADSGELGWIVMRHAEIYGKEYGFTKEFERYVLLGLAEYATKKNNAGSNVWIALSNDSPAGSVGIVETPENRAQLRWLLVEPFARGLGIGRMLVEQALSFCEEQAYDSVRLWTLQELHAARALYKSFGFHLVEEKQGVMGGKQMVEECWVLSLPRKAAVK
jgi:DNA-binding MarR family transcriptional regulator/GNAT superfamily N-acetyltransferase